MSKRPMGNRGLRKRKKRSQKPYTVTETAEPTERGNVGKVLQTRAEKGVQ